MLAIKSLGQQRYLSAVKHAEAVIGNSSSGIIEVPSFGVPTVDIGVRQKGRLAAGSVFHCEPNAQDITSVIKSAISSSTKKSNKNIKNPYGAGDASSQVIRMIKSLDADLIKKFHDLKSENEI